MKKVFVSWSGGKDSYLALLKAREAGLTISTLVTFFRQDNKSIYHFTNHAVLKQQADAMGLNLVSQQVLRRDSGEAMLKVMDRLRPMGISGGVFGDINSPSRREWVEWVCRRGKMTMHLPLWGIDEGEIQAELSNRKCRLLIVALRHDLIDKKWLGKELDDEFTAMCIQKGLNPCGERGEFHTLAVDGPLFKHPLRIMSRKNLVNKKTAFLDLNP